MKYLGLALSKLIQLTDLWVFLKYYEVKNIINMEFFYLIRVLNLEIIFIFINNTIRDIGAEKIVKNLSKLL